MTLRTIFLSVVFLVSLCAAASAQSCAPGSPRTRVTFMPVINVCPSGLDSNDGMTLATALQTPQRALDCADGNFDVDPSAGAWAPYSANGFVGRHIDVIVRLCATSPTAPHVLPNPAFYRGHNTVQITGPSTNRWDAPVYTANGYQGITAQGAGHLVISNLEMLGDGQAAGAATPTFINTLHGGLIMVENVGFSDAYQRAGHVGKVYPIGADMHSRIVQTGPWYMDGCHYGSIMASIGGSAVSIGGYPINWGPIAGSPCTSATYDQVYSLADGGQITNQTLPVNHVGMPLGGACAVVSRNAIIEFDPTASPSDTGVTGSLNCTVGGVAAYRPGSWIYWNYIPGLKVMGTDGAWH